MKDGTKHPLNFLDCNCGAGTTASGPLRPISALLEKMDALGIAESCPYALGALESEPMEQNVRLADAAKDRSRLHPVWVVGPHHCGEFPKPKELAAELSRGGVKMVRIPFSKVSFLRSFDLPLLENIFDALAPHHTPVILDCMDSSDQISTEDLRTILDRWPELPVILSFPKTVQQDDRRLYYLWERSNRLFVELAGYQVLGGIEAVTERFGSGRLVFGSRYPHFTPLQVMLQVIYSAVEETVKREIAGESVRRLLREVTP